MEDNEDLSNSLWSSRVLDSSSNQKSFLFTNWGKDEAVNSSEMPECKIDPSCGLCSREDVLEKPVPSSSSEQGRSAGRVSFEPRSTCLLPVLLQPSGHLQNSVESTNLEPVRSLQDYSQLSPGATSCPQNKRSQALVKLASGLDEPEIEQQHHKTEKSPLQRRIKEFLKRNGSSERMKASDRSSEGKTKDPTDLPTKAKISSPRRRSGILRKIPSFSVSAAISGLISSFSLSKKKPEEPCQKPDHAATTELPNYPVDLQIAPEDSSFAKGKSQISASDGLETRRNLETAMSKVEHKTFPTPLDCPLEGKDTDSEQGRRSSFLNIKPKKISSLRSTFVGQFGHRSGKAKVSESSKLDEALDGQQKSHVQASHLQESRQHELCATTELPPHRDEANVALPLSGKWNEKRSSSPQLLSGGGSEKNPFTSRLPRASSTPIEGQSFQPKELESQMLKTNSMPFKKRGKSASYSIAHLLFDRRGSRDASHVDSSAFAKEQKKQKCNEKKRDKDEGKQCSKGNFATKNKGTNEGIYGVREKFISKSDVCKQGAFDGKTDGGEVATGEKKTKKDEGRIKEVAHPKDKGKTHPKGKFSNADEKCRVSNKTLSKELIQPKDKDNAYTNRSDDKDTSTDMLTRQKQGKLSQHPAGNTPKKEDLDQSESINLHNISARLNLLKASQDDWKAKVVEKDMKEFTVEGRMSKLGKPINHPLMSSNQTPPGGSSLKTVQERAEGCLVVRSQSPAYSGQTLNRTCKSSPVIHQDLKPMQVKGQTTSVAATPEVQRLVEIPKLDDDLEQFFYSNANLKSTPLLENINLERGPLLQSAQKVRPVRRRPSCSNPIKKLAQRDDLLTSYEESPNPTRNQRLAQRLTPNATTATGFTAGAMAGLAAKLDLSQVSLQKSGSFSANQNLPYSERMLIQFKGRRFCQPRLVSPCSRSVNRGDCYVLVTPKSIHVWLGEFCNVIEKAKAIDFAKQTVKMHDLGCKTTVGPVVVNGEDNPYSSPAKDFWAILDESKEIQGHDSGLAKEDEVYDELVNSTNFVYRLEGNHLRMLSEYCGKKLACGVLDTASVLVFDFGVEMYVWVGKQSPRSDRRTGVVLALELWSEGYDYTTSKMNPISPFQDETSGGLPAKSPLRPPWTLFGKINQGTETILFKDKFIDWVDLSRVIRVKDLSASDGSKTKPVLDLKPCDVNAMINTKREPLYLLLDGIRLGRDSKWIEEIDGLKMEYEVKTEGLDIWHVAEFDHRLLDAAYHGHFYSGDTYVIRWRYNLSCKGLGVRSRTTHRGRDRCVYFFWQGDESSVTEKGACAMMTVELDTEKGPQIRVVQHKEPPCFLTLFKGQMIVHRGRQDDRSCDCGSRFRLYMVWNDLPDEAYLMEVTLGLEHLRSRSSFLLLNTETGQLTIWHGAKSPKHTKQRARELMAPLRRWTSLKLVTDLEISVEEVDEGSENADFVKAMGTMDRTRHDSLLSRSTTVDRSIRAFHLSSVTGSFEAKEVVNPTFNPSGLSSSFTLLQSDLYERPQPALFLVDSGEVVYLWQGCFWPEEGIHTGSAIARFYIDLRCAAETVQAYCQAVNPSNPPPSYLICSGVEPILFTNLFPSWNTELSARSSNLKNGKVPGQMTPVLEVLEQMKRRQYNLKELQGHPLPEGIDPLRLESYLSNEEFERVFGQSKDDFYSMPTWKQAEAKKRFHLF